MSSPHHVPTIHRPANALAGASTASARQFPTDPITLHRLLFHVRARLGGAWQVLRVWRQRSRDRAELRSLSSRDIRDFCARQAEAEEEMHKPFWRA